MTSAKTSPKEALELFRSQPDQFDLIITDYTMPQMVGADLAKECMRIELNSHLIISTGYSEKLSETDAAQMGIKGFAVKPLDRNPFGGIGSACKCRYRESVHRFRGME